MNDTNLRRTGMPLRQVLLREPLAKSTLAFASGDLPRHSHSDHHPDRAVLALKRAQMSR
ncbi:MAG: hypothetical protein ABI887_12935 [Burkholderiales bacterium]